MTQKSLFMNPFFLKAIAIIKETVLFTILAWFKSWTDVILRVFKIFFQIKYSLVVYVYVHDYKSWTDVILRGPTCGMMVLLSRPVAIKTQNPKTASFRSAFIQIKKIIIIFPRATRIGLINTYMFLRNDKSF